MNYQLLIILCLVAVIDFLLLNAFYNVLAKTKELSIKIEKLEADIKLLKEKI